MKRPRERIEWSENLDYRPTHFNISTPLCSSLPSETSFMCEVQLPETEMRTVKTAVYYPGARAEDVPAAGSSSGQSGQDSGVRTQNRPGSTLGADSGDCGRENGTKQIRRMHRTLIPHTTLESYPFLVASFEGGSGKFLPTSFRASAVSPQVPHRDHMSSSSSSLSFVMRVDIR